MGGLMGGGGSGGGSVNPFASAGGTNAYGTQGPGGGAPWGIGDSPTAIVGSLNDPVTQAPVQIQGGQPPPAPDTPAPAGQQSGGSKDQSWMDTVSNILLGKDSNQVGSMQAQATGAGGGPPTPTQSRPLTQPGAAPQTGEPGAIGNPAGDFTPTGNANPPSTQFNPSEPGGTPSGWGPATSMAAQNPAAAAGGPNPPAQLPLPPQPFPGEEPAAVSPQSPQISGKKNGKTAPDTAVATPPTGPDQYSSQGYTEHGAGYGDTSTGAGTATGGATAVPGVQGTQGIGGKGNALGDLLQGNFGRFLGDLFGGQGMPGGTGQPATSSPTGNTSPPGTPSPDATASAAPALPVTPTGVPNPQATPPTQLAGTSTGLPDQVARPGAAPSPTGVATAAPAAPSGVAAAEAATPPGAPTGGATVGTPGTMTTGVPGAGFSGGPPGDRPTAGNPQASQNYIAQNGGYSLTGFDRKRGGYGGFKMNPEFSNRLAAAGQAYERETGQKPQYGLGDRDPETQRFFWEDSRHGTRYAAAPPGRSLHQQGLAMDMPQGGFDHWLHQNGQRFGLGFPLGNDPNHIQMQDAHGRAFPYVPQTAEANMHIPGSQAPVGSRAPDPNYNPGDYARATFQIESGGNPGARTGSNRGLGQFGPQEEARYGLNARNRNDPNAQQAALQRETQDNTRILQNSLGRAPTGAELYLTHQQGQAGGPALLRAPADQPAWKTVRPFYRSDAIAKRAIRGNIPSDNPLRSTPVDQVSAGQFRGMWSDRYNREVARGGGRPGAPTAAATPGTAEQGARAMGFTPGQGSPEGRPLSQPTSTGPQASSTTYEDELRNRGQANVARQLAYVPGAGQLEAIARSALQPTHIGKDFAARPRSLGTQAGLSDIERLLYGWGGPNQ